MAHLSCTIGSDLAILCLHDPPRNRIGVEMIDELRQALHTIEISDAPTVLLRANGLDSSYGNDIEPWAIGGVAASDEAMFDIALPRFQTHDSRTAIPAAINGLRSGVPRPAMPFQGR